MKKGSFNKHKGLFIVLGLATVVGLYVGRKSVKTGICGIHKFGFCQADATLSVPLVSAPDITFGQLYGGKLPGSDGGNIYDATPGHGGSRSGGNCSAKDAAKGKCVQGI